MPLALPFSSRPVGELAPTLESSLSQHGGGAFFPVGW